MLDVAVGPLGERQMAKMILATREGKTNKSVLQTADRMRQLREFLSL